MPLPFSSIPEHLSIDIVQKLDLKDYVSYQKSSQESYNHSQKIRSRYPVNIGINHFELEYTDEVLLLINYRGLVYKWTPILELPLRFKESIFNIELSFTNKFCNALTQFLIQTNSTVRCLKLGYVNCYADIFDNLYDTGRITGLDFMARRTPFDVKSLHFHTFTKIDSLTLHSPLTDDDLSIIKIPTIYLYLTEITSFGLNKLIQDCINARRRVKDVQIHTYNNIDVNALLNGIPHSRCETCTNASQAFIVRNNEDMFKIAFHPGGNFAMRKIEDPSQLVFF